MDINWPVIVFIAYLLTMAIANLWNAIDTMRLERRVSRLERKG